MDEISRKEFNGLGSRVSGVELLKPKVERNEEDIQKIFEAMEKIPEQNSIIMKNVMEDNQKTFNKIAIGLILLILSMFIKEMVFK